jgi:uncharacterized protein (DUF2126 family)/transglutaminase-like putative cysteine protease
MTIKVALEHRTSYTFDRPVRVYPHVVRLRPAPHSRTPIEAYSLRVEPADHFINWQQDALGNFLARLVFPNPTSQLTITVGLIADLKVINPFDFFIEDWAETWPSGGLTYPKELADDLEPYLRPVDEAGDGSGPGELVTDWVRDFHVRDGTRTIDFLVALNRAVSSDVGYSVRMEPGVQTPDCTLRTGIGSCRDSAWLLVSILRQFGLAARFVSGYLVQLASDVDAIDGPSGPAADFTDLHAWAEVYIPGAGWIGLDPTSGLFAGEGHIPLAATPHPATAAPISGGIDPCESVLEFSNTVTRVHEDPRVTLPYTDEAWQTICAVGRHVDERLAAGDVRLTVGGEPTFVSVDIQTDKSREEWTTAADGPHKRRRASDLAARLKGAWAPHGLIQRGQGRWYPGEPLPRWQIALYWRADGQPLWTDDALLADPWGTDSNPPPAGRADNEMAYKLLVAIADGLAVPLSQVRPAYEDPLARLGAKVRLPEGDPVDPGDDLGPPVGDTAARRAALLAHLDESTTPAAAFVLPLHRRDDDRGWASADWRLRRGRVVLLDGDSPAGLRLPLDSISWKPPRPSFVTDPTTVDDALTPSDGVETLVDEDDEAPITAMVAEVRDGLLYVFMPPTEALEHFVDLIARLEAAAKKIGCPVVIEGYEPPPDPRLKSTTITPDPGVIEVNIAPTASFAEQSRQLETLYEQARLARLSTESFDVDGTHGGTGGGNHITLGGITPKDSPLLRRPDLLVSLLTYWQRHPSLSYLFAGRFVGTTSQAPRVDEGRADALYELEIAFAEIARLSSSSKRGRPPRWLTDRALRHLLTDITGNTHRAEFCIDKLYNPDSPRGRLGLLELRGFEMPPHLRMAMVQSLLVRALVAWFWDQPLRAPLIRHGSNLHGRYLLPHFLIHDIADVAADLRAHGIPFETSWLDPFTEFRFPRIGTAVFDSVEIELRGAIEPWNTLGEEATATGTARYVDSSVERIQVRIIGADRDRYLVTCNGYPVPLLATDNPDIHVGGVRFRAWQPPSALHPSITVDGPLQFELVDLTTATSRGGCTYHIAHPGGRAYDEPPVNAVEAESRRARRFEATGFTPGKLDLSDIREKQARISTDIGAPGILDLRRVRTVLR